MLVDEKMIESRTWSARARVCDSEYVCIYREKKEQIFQFVHLGVIDYIKLNHDDDYYYLL